MFSLSVLVFARVFYEKSRSGNNAGATHVQMYRITQIQLDTILTQSDA